MQDLEYFDNRVKEAQERVDQLEAQGYGSSTNMALFTRAYGQEEQQEFFIITDKEIEVMNEATEILHAMNDFDEWCTNNFETHAPQCYYVYSDFLIDNGGLISQIENVMSATANFLIPQVYGDPYENYKKFAEDGRAAQEKTIEDLDRLETKLLKICEKFEEADALEELDPDELEKCNELLQEEKDE